MRGAAVLLLLVLTAGCAIFPRKLEAPKGDDAVVMVLSTRLGGPLRKIARHAYLDVRKKGSQDWERWECCPPHGGSRVTPIIPSFGDQPLLHGVIRGARAERIIECLPGATEKYGDPPYWMWPGPNSNTYVEAMLRACGIHADLPSTSVGKDWRGLIGISWTSGGTGVQFETPLVGLRIGLTEGISVHVLALEIGIDLWPPAIIVPFGDGRIGFADR
jgi:hypothetical protein